MLNWYDLKYKPYLVQTFLCLCAAFSSYNGMLVLLYYVMIMLLFLLSRTDILALPLCLLNIEASRMLLLLPFKNSFIEV